MILKNDYQSEVNQVLTYKETLALKNGLRIEDAEKIKGNTPIEQQKSAAELGKLYHDCKVKVLKKYLGILNEQ